MKKYREGLVVGKFSPLHKGHQSLIDLAISQCDKVYVINYSNPPYAGCDGEERRYWFSILYPDVTYIGGPEMDAAAPANCESDVVHRMFCAHTLFFGHHTTVDAVFTSETYGDGLAQYLKDWFGSVLGRPHKVDHVLHDLHRLAFPTSGTAVRWNSFHRDAFLHEVVRVSMIPRVAILGGESSGKTTLANDLVEHYGPRTARNVPEYGRLFGGTIGNDYRLSDMEHIAEQQVALEHHPVNAPVQLQVCDTTPLVTLWYSLAWYNTASARLRQLANRKYDLTILCEPPAAYEDDGTRSGVEFRRQGYETQRKMLMERSIHFVEVMGTPDQRVRTVVRQIEQLGLLS